MPPSWTLPQALESAAGTRAGIYCIADDGRESFHSYQAFFDRARAVAGGLAARGLTRGDRVAILVPEAEGFLATLFGVSVGGFTGVPLAPPGQLARLDGALDSWKRLISAAGASVIVTTPQLRSILGTVQAALPAVRTVVSWEDLTSGPATGSADVRPTDVALIQFTSGSTSRPKGVVLTHENLGANVRAIMGPGGLNATQGDLGVSWLPLFHDMGLIGMVLGPLFVRLNVVLIPPLRFLKRPVEWLRVIARHRATISFAPNFAYDLCRRRIGDHERQGLDLSSWRVAGCGAESIRAQTLEEFASTFAPVGFRATSFLPCYGLAEHTLAATFHPVGQPWRVDTVHATALCEEHVAVPCPPDHPAAVGIVSCGRPFPDHGVTVLDDQGRPCQDRQVGEIVLSGPSVMQGYYGEETLTRQSLRDGRLCSGDLGYVAAGDLFVCGRKKDLIIVHGRNYYPQDLEWVASEVPGVRTGSVVAFGTGDPDGTERVVLVIECKPEVEFETVAVAVRRRIQDATGLVVHDVAVVPPRSIPKTTSGKLQRAHTKVLYETGQLRQASSRGRSLFGHLVSSRWGYAKVVARRLAARILKSNGRPDLDA